MNVTDLYTIEALCKQLDLEEAPPPIVRGLELIAVARAHAEPPTGPLLSLSDDDARGRIDSWSLRSHLYTHSGTGTGLTPGIEQFESQLMAEVHEAMLPFLDRIVDALRPSFDAAAAPIMLGAQRFGFSWQTTTSDSVIDAADEEVSAAWRATRDAMTAIERPVKMRIKLSQMFGLSPTADDLRRHYARLGEFDAPVGEDSIDHSVLFAQHDNWGLNRGFYLERNRSGGSLDWLALAQQGLRLNGVTEVQEKLAARGQKAA